MVEILNQESQELFTALYAEAARRELEEEEEEELGGETEEGEEEYLTRAPVTGAAS